MTKTNVMRLLDAAKIPYRAAEYEVDENDLNGMHAAEGIGMPPEQIFKTLVAKGERGGSIGRIIAQCRENGVVIKETDKRKLDKLCGGENHQGVAAWAAVHEYSDVEDILENARSKGEQPFIIICDEIEDPHNLGAIIRTADACGAHGIIIPKRRGVALTYAVGKVSAGAVEYVPVARVANLPSLIDELKEKGFWIYGADMDGTRWDEQDYSGAVALVVGSEGKGISRLVRE